MIETERLTLRPFRLEDAPAVFEFGSDPDVQQHTGDQPLQSLEEAEYIIKNINFKDYEEYGFGRWAVIYRPDQKLIGFCGLKFLPEFNKVDIGYRFLSKYWNMGIATESARAMIKYGFDILELEEIIGIAYPENLASCRVLEKIGLQFYKQAPYDEESPKKSNWYSLKRNEYLQSQNE